MKIICDLPEHQVNDIRRLINDGKYSSLDTFINIAVENQLNLELDELGNNFELKSTKQRMHFKRTKKNSDITIPIELKLNSPIKCSIVPAPNFSSLNIYKTTKEEDFWIWGQINKIFPIKIILRYLIKAIPKNEEYICLKSFSNDICTITRNLGMFLLQQDQIMDNKRDKKLSIALPTGQDRAKAFSRFSSLFIGHKRTDNKLSGALLQLKFANIIGEYGNEKIGITSEGFEFAKIVNPIIDKKIFDKTLSDDEINFYLHHIREKVPGELKLFKSILKYIENGSNKREELNSELKKIVNDNWSEKLISTQRSGAISRLYELNLITKHKIGKTIKYYTSNNGREFLNR